MMICYDWRFPEATRSLAHAGADLIVCPSNLVTNVWHKVMPARALENKVYLAVANRIGIESKGEEELFFTNREGYFEIYGLTEGNWMIELVENREYNSTFTIPRGTTGYYELWNVHLQKGEN
jgi:predicted amidohydrolase